MRHFTTQDLDDFLPDDDACLDYIRLSRWPDGIRCRRCERITRHYRMSGWKAHACARCGTFVYTASGTIFHKSSTPLTVWFQAIHMMVTSRNGVAAMELERAIGVFNTVSTTEKAS